MFKNRESGWEMQIVFWVFIVMCVCTLVDIIPSVDGSTWATRLYGIVCLAGVIFCARNDGMFMAIDAFTGMYPKSVQKTLALICKILSLLFLIIIEIAVILSFMNYMGSSPSTAEEIYNGVLYVASIIVYPVSFVYMARQLFTKKEEGEE